MGLKLLDDGKVEISLAEYCGLIGFISFFVFTQLYYSSLFVGIFGVFIGGAIEKWILKK